MTTPHAAPDGTGEVSGGITHPRPSVIEDARDIALEQLKGMNPYKMTPAQEAAYWRIMEREGSSMERDCQEQEIDARENRAAVERYRQTGDAT